MKHNRDLDSAIKLIILNGLLNVDLKGLMLPLPLIKQYFNEMKK